MKKGKKMHFRHIDTTAKDGAYVQFERVRLHDDCCDPADRDEGLTEERVKAYYAGDWEYIGIMARAVITVVKNGTGTIYIIESAGLFGIESDSEEEYLEEVFKEHKVELMSDLVFIGHATIVS